MSISSFLTRPIVFVATVLCVAGAAHAQSCVESRVHLQQEGTLATFSVEIADTMSERAQGLMFREDLAMFSGMLFDFDDGPQARSFWMRNTPLSLDIVFINEAGVIRTIHRNARPNDSTAIDSEADDIVAVLEVNGGMMEMLGFSEGAVIRHPIFDTEIAAWPCIG